MPVKWSGILLIDDVCITAQASVKIILKQESENIL